MSALRHLLDQCCYALSRLGTEVGYQLGRLGYAIRPYDMLADRRHWRWQPAAPCGLGGLTPSAREHLLAVAGVTSRQPSSEARAANAIAAALVEHIGWVPLSVRHRAARAAIRSAQDWIAAHPEPQEDDRG